MISPAKTKNGIAKRVKLSEPLIRFCATSIGSNMSKKNMSARPHIIRAKAIGMPMAMLTKRTHKKMATSMIRPP